MSDPTRADETGPEPLEAFFRMGRRKPTIAILLVLALLAVAGTLAAAVVNEKGEIPPHVPSRNTRERLSLPGVVHLALAKALAQAQQPTVGPPASGDAEVVTLGPDDAVVIEVPEGWTVLSQDEEDSAFAFFSGPDGATFGAELVNVDPVTPAGDLLVEAIDGVLAKERYTGRRLSDLASKVPFGHLVSWAITGYSAVRTDPQGAQSVGGNLSVFVREDGLGLILNSEVTPVGSWDDGIAAWEPLYLNAAESFARQEFP
ncbi:MAG: hypothetical protein LC722_07875 [Actinobacteria bacterium]|nr:hypothetical protein [Actinomycetota bacterium]